MQRVAILTSIGPMPEAVRRNPDWEWDETVLACDLVFQNDWQPLPPEEANLLMIPALKARYGVPVGYSGHEPGLQISLAAVAMGAVAVEHHITLDRAMWGSDHAASLEPHGLMSLVRDIRIIGTAMGDGVKRVFPGELAPLSKLRRVDA